MQTIDSGYAIQQHRLASSECEAILRALSDSAIARSRAGARHLMANPIVAELSTDTRLLALARDLLGANASPFRATLFEKSGDTNWLIPWHQDTALPLTKTFDAPGWGPWSKKAGTAYAHAPAWALSRIVALRIHLDASTADNGPLRVVPGSQSAGLLSDHDARRVLHIEYTDSLDLSPGIRLAIVSRNRPRFNTP